MIATNSKDSGVRSSATHCDQWLTIVDLEAFKDDLRIEIGSVLKESKGQPVKQWLRSSEVLKMVGVSPGTLQNLRMTRMLSYSKISGIFFNRYDGAHYCDEKMLMEENHEKK